ncbi:MAG TPA: tRNA lysidine(34) synthetase TilS [Solirubrobacteraceae bacterium]
MTPEELPERVRRERLLGESEAVIVMVSGGRDSVCLLDVAVAVRGAASVRALHVNYGLRGEDADADELHCTELCTALSVELDVVRAVPDKREPGNLHAWARELRYGAAMRLAEALDGSEERVQGLSGPRELPRLPGSRSADRTRIAAGHTASDQVETILYRLAASPGRRALLGMAPREGRLVRPLLGVTRAQTTAYCESRGLAWREDQSNDNERFARARVRSGLVHALRAVHPAAEANVLRTARMLREETALLDGLVDAELAGEQRVAIARLRELPGALQRMLVVRLAEHTADDYVPQAGARVPEILALAERGGHAELHVGGNVSAVVEHGVLTMRRLPSA